MADWHMGQNHYGEWTYFRNGRRQRFQSTDRMAVQRAMLRHMGIMPPQHDDDPFDIMSEAVEDYLDDQLLDLNPPVISQIPSSTRKVPPCPSRTLSTTSTPATSTTTTSSD